ncbi:matrilin-1-like [Tubulanus polymorphus]|uniref:matrilin-1-like n=1 Tax=Tubulanus polymorphus TaxID=672921 RepID=UPI003DA4E020
MLPRLLIYVFAVIFEVAYLGGAPLDKKEMSLKISDCGDKADIMFILDASSSVGSRNFWKVKSFLRYYASSLEIGKDHVHVGAIRFSRMPKIEFGLTDHLDKKSLLAAVDGLEYGRGGTTATDKAIRLARKSAIGYRPGSPSILILITDGQSNRPHLTYEEAEAAKKSGMIFFTVGVGSQVNQEELEKIAMSLEFVFHVSDYSSLDAILSKVARKTCEILKYSKDNPVEYKARCKYVSKSRPSYVYELMQGTSWHDGCKWTCKCIDALRNGISCQERCKKWNVKAADLPSNCKMITIPGRCACKELRFVNTYRLTCASHTQAYTVSTYKTGRSKIHSYVKEIKGAQIAKMIFRFAIIAALLGAAVLHAGPLDKRALLEMEKITKRAGYSVESVESKCGDEADIMFALDASSSVGRRNFEKIKSFVHHFASNFDVSEEHIHVGAIRFSRSPEMEFSLTDHLKKKPLLEAVDKLTYGHGGTTATGAAIKLARESLFNKLAGFRPSAAEILILITDGQSNRPHDTYQETEAAKERGVIFFTVGVGSEVNQEELETIASSLEFVFHVSDYSSLDTILGELAKKTCEVLRYSKDNPVEYKARCKYANKYRSAGMREFMQGATWHDGCKLTCKCNDALRNGISCKERCPQWRIVPGEIPSNCQLITKPGDCGCKEIKCT